MKKILKIANKSVGQGRPVFIIAEAGVNHNGDLGTALKMIDAAAEAGADAIKFQTFKAEQLASGMAQMSKYQRVNTGSKENQLSMLKRLEVKDEFYPSLLKRCREKKITFISTPHGGFKAVDWLIKIKAPAFKFASGDLNNLPLLAYAAKFKKPMILGTGMATMEEVLEAVKTIKKNGNDKIIMLHCTTNYPTPLNEANLKAMRAMMEKAGTLIGYSDHTPGIQVPVMAATLGACLIEKHFTLDRNMPGPDHKASMEPDEFKEMAEALRRVPAILGSETKRPIKSELPTIPLARKSLISACRIKKGEKLTSQNVDIKRPGNGLPPKYYELVLGKTAKKDIEADSFIKLADLK